MKEEMDIKRDRAMKKASELLAESAEPFDKACLMVASMEDRIAKLEKREAELMGVLKITRSAIAVMDEYELGESDNAGKITFVRDDIISDIDKVLQGKGDSVTVPRKPTEEMLDAAWELNFQHIERWMHDNMMEAKYKAMITAAQSNKGEGE